MLIGKEFTKNFVVIDVVGKEKKVNKDYGINRVRKWSSTGGGEKSFEVGGDLNME